MRTNAIRKMKRLRLLMIRDSHFSGCPEYLCRDLSWLNIEDPLTHIPSTSHSSNKWVPEETVCDRINSSRGKANSGQGGCSDLKCFHVAPKRLLHFAMTVPRLFAHAMVSSSSIVRRKSSDKSCSPVHSGGLEQALKVEFEVRYSCNH